MEYSGVLQSEVGKKTYNNAGVELKGSMSCKIHTFVQLKHKHKGIVLQSLSHLSLIDSCNGIKDSN